MAHGRRSGRIAPPDRETHQPHPVRARTAGTKAHHRARNAILQGPEGSLAHE